MAIISMSQLLPDAKNGSYRFIRVSRNIIDMAPNLTMEQLNLIIAIVYNLVHQITFKPDEVCRDYGEKRIEIPRQYVSLHHASDVTGLLITLMEFSFVFKYNIPGYQSTGITRLISSVKCENGRVIVTIPGDTIPWLLYCGKSVGFGHIETGVFFKLKKRPEKLLYLYLLSKVDKSTARSNVNISTQELNTVLGVKETRPISSLDQKYLKHFNETLNRAGSRYQVAYELTKQQGYTGRPGTRPISSVSFVVRNTAMGETDQDVLAELADRLTKLWKKYKNMDVSVVWLIGAIDQTNKQDEIIDKMRRVSQKLEKDQNYSKAANTAAYILRNDYGIDINAYPVGNKIHKK